MLLLLCVHLSWDIQEAGPEHGDRHRPQYWYWEDMGGPGQGDDCWGLHVRYIANTGITSSNVGVLCSIDTHYVFIPPVIVIKNKKTPPVLRMSLILQREHNTTTQRYLRGISVCHLYFSHRNHHSKPLQVLAFIFHIGSMDGKGHARRKRSPKDWGEKGVKEKVRRDHGVQPEGGWRHHTCTSWV